MGKTMDYATIAVATILVLVYFVNQRPRPEPELGPEPASAKRKRFLNDLMRAFQDHAGLILVVPQWFYWICPLINRNNYIEAIAKALVEVFHGRIEVLVLLRHKLTKVHRGGMAVGNIAIRLRLDLRITLVLRIARDLLRVVIPNLEVPITGNRYKDSPEAGLIAAVVARDLVALERILSRWMQP